jgi:chemotaxis signal transduction protein
LHEVRVDDQPAVNPSPLDRPGRAWFLFRGEAGTYAVALESVVEVVEVDGLVSLPHSPPQVLGLCTLRRELIPVVAPDVCVWSANTGPSRITVVILKTSRGRWGFRVSPGGTMVVREEMEEVAALESARDGSDLGIAGKVRWDGQVYAVIDPDATWNRIRERVEAWYQNHWGRETAPALVGVAAAGAGSRGSSLLEVGR